MGELTYYERKDLRYKLLIYYEKFVNSAVCCLKKEKVENFVTLFPLTNLYCNHTKKKNLSALIIKRIVNVL